MTDETLPPLRALTLFDPRDHDGGFSLLRDSIYKRAAGTMHAQSMSTGLALESGSRERRDQSDEQHQLPERSSVARIHSGQMIADPFYADSICRDEQTGPAPAPAGQVKSIEQSNQDAQHDLVASYSAPSTSSRKLDLDLSAPGESVDVARTDPLTRTRLRRKKQREVPHRTNRAGTVGASLSVEKAAEPSRVADSGFDDESSRALDAESSATYRREQECLVADTMAAPLTSDQTCSAPPRRTKRSSNIEKSSSYAHDGMEDDARSLIDGVGTSFIDFANDNEVSAGNASEPDDEADVAVAHIKDSAKDSIADATMTEHLDAIGGQDAGKAKARQRQPGKRVTFDLDEAEPPQNKAQKKGQPKAAAVSTSARGRPKPRRKLLSTPVPADGEDVFGFKSLSQANLQAASSDAAKSMPTVSSSKPKARPAKGTNGDKILGANLQDNEAKDVDDVSEGEKAGLQKDGDVAQASIQSDAEHHVSPLGGNKMRRPVQISLDVDDLCASLPGITSSATKGRRIASTQPKTPKTKGSYQRDIFSSDKKRPGSTGGSTGDSSRKRAKLEMVPASSPTMAQSKKGAGFNNMTLQMEGETEQNDRSVRRGEAVPAETSATEPEVPRGSEACLHKTAENNSATDPAYQPLHEIEINAGEGSIGSEDGVGLLADDIYEILPGANADKQTSKRRLKKTVPCGAGRARRDLH